ncbi:MAG: prepilin-type N-terminal cleavage/methylation domain-containing protein [Candidatus Ozemobacteraceae bacterium]
MKSPPATGFTFVELVVACLILGIFLSSAFLLFRGGQKAGGQALWLQNIVGEMRSAVRRMSENARRASLPSTIIFAGGITENTSEDFWCRISGRSPLFATEAAVVNGNPEKPGTRVLLFVEASPECIGGETSRPASISYHLYSLTSTGHFLYHRFEETVPRTSPPAYISGLRHASVPPPEAHLKESRDLLTAVESLEIFFNRISSSPQPLSLSITCSQPDGKSRRTERITLVPTTPILVVPRSTPDW